jgi:putative oxidoreductase
MEPFDALFALGRLLLGGHYLVSGVQHSLNWQQRVAVMTRLGVPMAPAALALGMTLQIACSLLVILGLWTVYAAAGLIVFTVAATVIFHNFLQNAPGPDRAREIHHVLTNAALIGGFLILIAASL